MVVSYEFLPWELLGYSTAFEPYGSINENLGDILPSESNYVKSLSELSRARIRGLLGGRNYGGER